MSTQHRRRPILALAAAVAAMLIAGVAPALGHADLVSSDPADGAQLTTPPATITLTFSEGLDAGKSSFRLNQNGTNVATAAPIADGDTTMTLTGLSLAPGGYVIRWISYSQDGHLLRGTVTFTVLAPSPGASSPAPTPPSSARASDAAGSPTPAASATTAPSEVALTPSPQPSSDTAPAAATGSDVLLPIVVGLLLVAGVGAFLLRRTRRV